MKNCEQLQKLRAEDFMAPNQVLLRATGIPSENYFSRLHVLWFY